MRNMVRPGILLYGVYPSPEVARSVPVRPALAWKSHVVYFKVVRAGGTVSYGATWTAATDTRIATIPVGSYPFGIAVNPVTHRDAADQGVGHAHHPAFPAAAVRLEVGVDGSYPRARPGVIKKRAMPARTIR